MSLLSDLRMGVGAEGAPQAAIAVLNGLLSRIQPNQLSAAAGKPLSEVERDRARAALLRDSI